MKKLFCLLLSLIIFGTDLAETKKVDLLPYSRAMSFIKEELANCGVNLETVDLTFILTSDFDWSVSSFNGKHILYIPYNKEEPYSIQKLEDCLTTNNKEMIASYQFIINHEANHILCDHAVKHD